MVQRFIELGEGYSDIYELLEIAKTNQNRIKNLVVLHTTIEGKEMASIAVVLNPALVGDFLPIYICREGIPIFKDKPSQRFSLFKKLSEELNKPTLTFEIKPSTAFSDKALYYQYLIGILRLYHVIPHL
jgi:succinylglutamate desuccinylase